MHVCQICQLRLASKKELRTHQQNQHRKWICFFCTRMFDSKDTQIEHMLSVHTRGRLGFTSLVDAPEFGYRKVRYFIQDEFAHINQLWPDELMEGICTRIKQELIEVPALKCQIILGCLYELTDLEDKRVAQTDEFAVRSSFFLCSRFAESGFRDTIINMGEEFTHRLEIRSLKGSGWTISRFLYLDMELIHIEPIKAK